MSFLFDAVAIAYETEYSPTTHVECHPLVQRERENSASHLAIRVMTDMPTDRAEMLLARFAFSYFLSFTVGRCTRLAHVRLGERFANGDGGFSKEQTSKKESRERGQGGL